MRDRSWPRIAALALAVAIARRIGRRPAHRRHQRGRGGGIPLRGVQRADAALCLGAHGPGGGVGLVVGAYAALLVGALDEWTQWFVPGRTGEIRDVAINAISVTCGLLLARALDLGAGARRGARAWPLAAGAAAAAGRRRGILRQRASGPRAAGRRDRSLHVLPHAGGAGRAVRCARSRVGQPRPGAAGPVLPRGSVPERGAVARAPAQRGDGGRRRGVGVAREADPREVLRARPAHPDARSAAAMPCRASRWRASRSAAWRRPADAAMRTRSRSTRGRGPATGRSVLAAAAVPGLRSRTRCRQSPSGALGVAEDVHA